LVITSAEGEESASPVYEDPFLIGGHCVLTLFAAALGGVLAPLVSDARRQPRIVPQNDTSRSTPPARTGPVTR